MSEIGATLRREISAERMEVRYPFLSRPLVEFALTLPPDLLVRPRLSKWILREAMRDLLPPSVRTRKGKGTVGARIRWSLEHERVRIHQILSNSILADLGCIEPRKALEAVASAKAGTLKNMGQLLSCLSLETWLYVRSDQWKTQEHDDATNTHSEVA
jgi:asparagine synthase (glutamine-hydrolysing)